MPLFAQTDTLVQLPVIEVNATSLRKEQIGGFSERWEVGSLPSSSLRSVADFLQNQTGIYLKSYGGGSLATVSIRGASASQTAVLWNGFQVQSPMLGLLDWSLLPLFFFDEITLQHGGNSAVWGSGAVGGAVLMENKADFSIKQLVKLAAGHGSFGNWSGHASARFSNQKLASATRIFYKKTQNDFAFQSNQTQPKKRQTNAAMKLGGLSQEFYLRPSANFEIGWHTWLQRSFREIPPTLVQTRSEANQTDESLRSAINLTIWQRENVLQARSAWFRESIRYRDGQTGLDAPSHFWTNINEVEWRRIFSKKTTVQLAGNHSTTKAFVKNYKVPASRRQAAAFASVRYLTKKGSAQLDARQELVDGNLAPFTPSLGAVWKVAEVLSIKTKIGRNYRLPTLNDLHWLPGGNPNLLAETGWSGDLGAHLTLQRQLHQFQLASTFFNRKMKNWILWHPKEGQAYWSAANVAEVWSRGLENRLDLSWTGAKWRCQASAGYDFIHSTNQKAIASPKMEAGQQLIYVPEHQGFASVKVKYGSLEMEYRHQFTGRVLTELGSLPGFRTGEFEVHFERTLRGHVTHGFFQLENCWGANYRVVERRPMPGRSFEAGISINFVKN